MGWKLKKRLVFNILPTFMKSDLKAQYYTGSRYWSQQENLTQQVEEHVTALNTTWAQSWVILFYVQRFNMKMVFWLLQNIEIHSRLTALQETSPSTRRMPFKCLTQSWNPAVWIILLNASNHCSTQITTSTHHASFAASDECGDLLHFLFIWAAYWHFYYFLKNLPDL